MSVNVYRRVQAIILVATGAFLVQKILSGTLFWYINERYTWLIALTAAGLIGLAFVIMPRKAANDPSQRPNLHYANSLPDRAKPNWLAVAVVALPVLIGVIIPARPLSSSAMGNKDLNLVAANPGGGNALQLQIPSTERTILDWIVLFNYTENPERYVGELAVVDGFVFNDPRLEEGQFMLGRFTLTCCAADSSAVAMLIDASAVDIQAYGNDTWLEISGPVTMTEIDGMPIPLIVAERVQEISEPGNPYLYP